MNRNLNLDAIKDIEHLRHIAAAAFEALEVSNMASDKDLYDCLAEFIDRNDMTLIGLDYLLEE